MNSPLAAIVGAALFLSEFALRRLRRVARTDAVAADAGTLRLVWIVILGAIFAGSCLGSARVGPALPAGWPWDATGLGLFLAGSALRWWAVWKLGRFFTVEVAVASDQTVISDGPYAWVRHPSYSGSLLQTLGLALLFGRWSAVVAMLVPITAVFLVRIHQEETVLRASLGEPYRRYAEKTRRLVPFVY